ncbi:MAG: hypothetical protein E7166_00630 [Firmicutes bacterium]|nr:hypothetical protein [Bacillota bacterium]
MENEVYNEIIEKYHIQNYMDLLSVCLGQGKARQKKFIEYLGDNADKDFSVDVPNAKLTIGSLTFDIEFIGSSSQSDGTWLWADANRSFMKEHTQTVKQLYSIGKKYNIKEFLEAKSQLSTEITAHNMSKIACILLSNNLCYYAGTDSGITLSMFVKNLPSSIYEPIDTIKFNTIVLECISSYNINHKLFVQSFLEMNKCIVSFEDNKTIGTWENGNKYIVEFDENGRVKNANMNMISN